MKRLVLDTQIWIDWLVFDDPSVGPLKAAVAARRAEVVIDRACHAEFERVLDYPLGKRAVAPEDQRAYSAACLGIARLFTKDLNYDNRVTLPHCADPDDQKFLELAEAARADALVTRDKELLVLAKRVAAFRIATPQDIEPLLTEEPQP